MAATAALSFSSCTKEAKLSTNKLEFTAFDVSFKSVEVKNANSWDFEVDPDAIRWIRARKEGNNLIVSVAGNEEEEDGRESSVTITADGKKMTLTVVQAGSDAVLLTGGTGYFYGDRTKNEEVGEFMIRFIKSSYPETGLYFEGYYDLSEADHSNFSIPDGTYTPAVDGARVPGTYRVGYKDGTILRGTFTYENAIGGYGGIESGVFVDEGNITIKKEGNKYLLITDELAGNDLKTGVKMDDKSYYYSGALSFLNTVKGKDAISGYEATTVRKATYTDLPERNVCRIDITLDAPKRQLGPADPVTGERQEVDGFATMAIGIFVERTTDGIYNVPEGDFEFSVKRNDYEVNKFLVTYPGVGEEPMPTYYREWVPVDESIMGAGQYVNLDLITQSDFYDYNNKLSIKKNADDTYTVNLSFRAYDRLLGEAQSKIYFFDGSYTGAIALTEATEIIDK